MKFIGGPWTKESRAGTFARFFDFHAGLSRATFLDLVKAPHLVIGLDYDPKLWDQGIIVRLEGKDDPTAKEVSVGRDPSSDVTLYCPTMSKHHSLFSLEGSDWFVKDRGSATGTLLKKQPVAPETAVKVEPIPADTNVKLEGDRPEICFGPDVTAVFLVPDKLYDLLVEARAHRAAVPAQGAQRTTAVLSAAKWPTWALLQEPSKHSFESTRQEIPVLNAEDLIEKSTARPKPPAESWWRQFRDLFITPKRVVVTLIVIAVVVGSAKIYGRPLAFMLFGGSHPEWFRGR
jgi:hypothetical protein